jgi:hypothetical protein
VSSTRDRLLFAAASASAIAVLAYAAIRPVELLFFPAPDPATVIWSTRSSFAWRAIVAGYVGGMGGFGGFALFTRAPALAARWLGRLVLIAAAAIAIQGTVLP